MSKRKNKPDMGDYAEGALQAATTAAGALRKSPVGKLAGALFKRANPLELALTATETMALLPPKGGKEEDWRKVRAARAKAAAEVEAMALDPNVTQVDRFIKGLADPAQTGYGITKGFQRLYQAQGDAHKSRMEAGEAGNRAAMEDVKRAWEVMKRAKGTRKQADLLDKRTRRNLLRWAAEDAKADVKARAAVSDRYIQNKEYSPQDWRR